MVRNILVPLDGSVAAEHALPWALSLAARANAGIRLAHVHVVPTPTLAGTEFFGDLSFDATLRQQEKVYIEEVAGKLRSAGAKDVSSEVLEGPIVDSLSDYSSKAGVDLALMTTHGRGAFARFWLGSVVDEWVRSCSVPTYLFRPEGAAPPLTLRPEIRHLLIPLDGTALGEQAVAPASEIGKLFGSDFTLLLVLDAVPDIHTLTGMTDQGLIPVPGYGEVTRTKATEYLNKVADKLKEKGLKVETNLQIHGSAASVIIEHAHRRPDTVIALATHGRGGLGRIIMGSVTDKVIRGSTTPVLVYHPTGKA